MITVILQSNNSKSQAKEPTRFYPSLNQKYQKYSVTKLRQATGRAVDLRSALGPVATFVNKCKTEIKVYHKQ